MREVLNILGIFLAVLVIAVVMSMAHEWDIARACQRTGTSERAGWTVTIQCHEMVHP